MLGKVHSRELDVVALDACGGCEFLHCPLGLQHIVTLD